MTSFNINIKSTCNVETTKDNNQKRPCSNFFVSVLDSPDNWHVRQGALLGEKMRLQQNQKDVTCQCCGGKNFSVLHKGKRATIFFCHHCHQSVTLFNETYQLVKGCETCDNRGHVWKCPHTYYSLCLGHTRQNSDSAPEYNKYVPIVL